MITCPLPVHILFEFFFTPTISWKNCLIANKLITARIEWLILFFLICKQETKSLIITHWNVEICGLFGSKFCKFSRIAVLLMGSHRYFSFTRILPSKWQAPLPWNTYLVLCLIICDAHLLAVNLLTGQIGLVWTISSKMILWNLLETFSLSIRLFSKFLPKSTLSLKIIQFGNVTTSNLVSTP